MRPHPCLLLALLLLLTGPLGAGGPADAVAAAWADARRQPEEIRHHLRYLSLYAIPEAERADFLKALTFHCNGLSREAELIAPVRITPDLVRVYFVDYGWEREVWEKLANVEPYFHLRDTRVIRVVAFDRAPGAAIAIPPMVRAAGSGKVFVERGGFLREVDRSDVRPGEKTFVRAAGGHLEEERAAASGAPAGQAGQAGKQFDDRKQARPVHAPWLDSKQIAELATLLNSDVPIVRADWFLYWTCQSVNRGGAGYYEFLGLKNLKDAERLAGLDVETARRIRKEMAALVDDSGVALNNRQILWFGTIAGSWWQSLDGDESIARQNALRLLDGDFEAKAFEIYFSLPNGLWGLVASDNKGALQATVPDTIASDSMSASNDKRIHCGFSCVRCHVEGIRPIDDWARATYTGPVALASRDPKKLKRLQQLYLSDLPRRIARDNADYAEVLLRVNGLKPGENARAYGAAFSNYFERRLTFEAQCREWSVDPKIMRHAIETYVRQGDADPVLSATIARVFRPMRREHAEEIFALAQSLIRGVRP